MACDYVPTWCLHKEKFIKIIFTLSLSVGYFYLSQYIYDDRMTSIGFCLRYAAHFNVENKLEPLCIHSKKGRICNIYCWNFSFLVYVFVVTFNYKMYREIFSRQILFEWPHCNMKNLDCRIIPIYTYNTIPITCLKRSGNYLYTDPQYLWIWTASMCPWAAGIYIQNVSQSRLRARTVLSISIRWRFLRIADNVLSVFFLL